MATCIPILKHEGFRKNNVYLLYAPGIDDVRKYRLAIFLKKPINGKDLIYRLLNKGQGIYEIPPQINFNDIDRIEFWEFNKVAKKKI